MRPANFRGRGLLVLPVSLLMASLLIFGGGSPAADASAPARATRVGISAINLHVGIIEVGMSHGAQEVTPSAHVFFHWRHGVVPGQPGSAVLAGHTCIYTPSCAGHGVGNKLGQLKPGDLIHIRVGKKTVTFKVTSVHRHAHPSAKQVRSMYSTSGPSRLVVITCGDPHAHHYGSHVVVRAVRMNK